MKVEDIDWHKKTQLYILVIDCFVKFGITSNWKKREKLYIKEFENQEIIVIKTFDFSTRWQAELIEQVVKWRLKKWIVFGRHEYTQLPIQQVLNCVTETIEELKNEYQRHEYIHNRGKERWDFYKQIAQIFFKEIKMKEEVKSIIPDLSEVNIYCNCYSESNIGKSAYSIILAHNEHEKKISAVYRLTTTNRIDLLGIINGFEKLKRKSKVNVFTNSMYIVDAFNKKWIESWCENDWISGKKNVANVDLWKKLLEFTQFHEVTFSYSKDERIPECLDIAKRTFKDNNILIDDFYENSKKDESTESIKKEQVSLKINKEGDLCRKCNTAVIKKIPSHKKIKKNQSYYFEYYMFCPKCATMYMVEEAKKLI